MTVALAVHKNQRIILAADTLVHYGGQRFPQENCRIQKIYRVGNSVLAWAGWSLYAELLDAYFAAEQPPDLVSERAVFSFFIRFWRSLRDDYTFLSRRTPTDSHPFVDLDSTFLIANRGGIFRVSGDMDVTYFQHYCAIGSGAQYALGALRILYDECEDPWEMARRAAQVGIDFNVYCDGEIDMIELE